MIRFLSICSGIEAASVAWKPLGWKAVGFAEIEPFPSAVLAHHYPEVPNFGDMTTFEEWKIDEPVDLVCGGTPCQAFSIAGKRGGMDDARGQLSLKFVEIVARYRPRWVVWENVPGVFSSGGGADFGSFLGALTGRYVQAPADGWGNSGVLEGIPDAYGVAWRTLDAQHFGVPQRRRRVFVVGYLGDWRRAAAVLFERESLCGHPPPSRQAGEGTARDAHGGVVGSLCARDSKTVGSQFVNEGKVFPVSGAVLDNVQTFDRQSSGEYGEAPNASTVSARDYKSAADLVVKIPAAGKAGGGEFQRLETTHTLRADGFDASEDGTGRGTPLVAVAPSNAKCQMPNAELPIAIQERAVSENPENGPQGAGFRSDGQAYTLEARSKVQAVACFKGGQGAKAGSIGYSEHLAPTLGAADSGSNRAPALMTAMQVRRLTPRECERLQGFPDDYTRIPWRKAKAEDCPDGPRYKALGNSWAVPCARWIGERIQMVEALP